MAFWFSMGTCEFSVYSAQYVIFAYHEFLRHDFIGETIRNTTNFGVSNGLKHCLNIVRTVHMCF